MQPWRFVIVRDPEVKRRIRLAAEEEERAFYERRAPDDWLSALAPLGTDWRKEFLEAAPCLIVVFRLDPAAPVYSAHSLVTRRTPALPEDARTGVLSGARTAMPTSRTRAKRCARGLHSGV
jgi:nitroreductase